MITWKDYITWMGILTLVYYLLVIAKYYRAEIKGWLSGKGTGAATGGETSSGEENTPELFKATEKAISTLKESLRLAAAAGNNREETLSSVKQVLGKYAYLKGTPYAIAIHHFLERETGATVRLKEEEMKDLWG